MPKSTSLWPNTFNIEAVSQAVTILREQADALKEITGGILYGEVVKSPFNSVKEITYDFFVGVEGKSFRHKLFSIQYGFLFDYPITINNYGAEKIIQVENRTAFVEQIKQVLSSEETKRIIGRMLEVAK